MQKTPGRPRLPQIHSTIERSRLTKSAKALLRFIVNSKAEEFSFGVHTIAERLRLDPTTVRAALRKIDDTSPTGAAILELTQEARYGTQPRVYRVKVERITAGNLARAAAGMDRAIGGESEVEIPALGVLAGNPRPKSPRITTSPLEDVREAAEQPPTRESRSNVIPFPSKPRGTRAESLQGQAASRAAGGRRMSAASPPLVAVRCAAEQPPCKVMNLSDLRANRDDGGQPQADESRQPKGGSSLDGSGGWQEAV